MQPSDLDAYRARRGWSANRLAGELHTPVQTVRDWLNGARVPGAVPLAVCELERRRAEREGLGHRSCDRCEGIAVEDDGLDDRYGCVLCGERVEPDETPRRQIRTAREQPS